jgi:hypothetical protein
MPFWTGMMKGIDLINSIKVCLIAQTVILILMLHIVQCLELENKETVNQIYFPRQIEFQ